jgi:hypothetical protein
MAITLRTPDVSGDLVTKLLETPDLARAVQSLEPAVLHALVRHCGLEDCGPIVALATTEQLVRVFDADLWRADAPGREEELDAERFGLWLEVLVEAGADVVAERIASMDFDFVTAAFLRHVLVLDATAMLEERATAESIEEEGGDGQAWIDEVEGALEGGVSLEVGGYRLLARRAEAWDAVIAVLTSLDAEHHSFFGRLMARLGALSTEWIVDNGGLYDVLTSEEQVLSDAAADRGERRQQEGYVDPPLAVAFLDLARRPIRGEAAPPPRDYFTAAYFRRFEHRATERASRAAEACADSTPRDSTPPETRRLVTVLRDAGVLPASGMRLLGPAASGDRDRLSRVRGHLLRLREEDETAHGRATAELGYLANVLVAGCSFRSRRFRAVEAADAALAVCNLGLESWRRAWPEARDLSTAFRVGWSVLHERVGLHVARGLADVLAGLETSDPSLRGSLAALRRRIEAEVKTGTPWRIRPRLDVLAVLDGPSWTTLDGLLDECPVVARAAAGEFDFISEDEQILRVDDFVQSLPERLAG